MIGEILTGTAVYLISNPTGRKIAKKGFVILTNIGDIVIKSLPHKVGSALGSVERVVNRLTTEKPKIDGG